MKTQTIESDKLKGVSCKVSNIHHKSFDSKTVCNKIESDTSFLVNNKNVCKQNSISEDVRKLKIYHLIVKKKNLNS